jgi:beta-lactamase class A
MGVEHCVVLWYVRQQVLLRELSVLESELEQMHTTSDSQAGDMLSASSTESLANPELPNLELQYTRVKERLRALGPCPRSMMG